MILEREIQNILEANGVCSIEILKDLTREDLKSYHLDKDQIQQVIIYLQLHGLDIKKGPKKK